MARLAALVFAALAAAVAQAKLVTIRNDIPRLDVNGNYVDAHDGCIVAHNGTYFLYGETYGNVTGGIFPSDWGNYPQMAVYTSPDMVTWTLRGYPLASDTADSTKWIPNVLWVESQQRFVMWGSSGDWFTATSIDGIAFNLVNAHVDSRLGQDCDGTGFFVDDDGAGYVIFAASNHNHIVSIERLTPDLLNSTQQNVSDFFPDGGVESPGLFKRGATYYVTYGACCCACRGGGGVVIFTAPSINGPWTRQAPYSDVNCYDANAQVCSGDPNSPTRDQLVYNAQWWGPSSIPLANGTVQVLMTGRRWLSGFGNNPACDDMCGNGGGRGGPNSCRTPAYQLATDFVSRRRRHLLRARSRAAAQKLTLSSRTQTPPLRHRRMCGIRCRSRPTAPSSPSRRSRASRSSCPTEGRERGGCQRSEFVLCKWEEARWKQAA